MNEININTAACPDCGWAPWIALIPPLLWAALTVGFMAWIGRDTLRALLTRVSNVSVAGVELRLRDSLETIVSSKKLQISGDELGRAVRRLATSIGLIEGARILWVDDVPNNNLPESQLLERAGARITWALSSSEAFDKLNRENFDLILSDMARGSENQAGIAFLDQLASWPYPPPFIFYVGTVTWPPPQHAFGITNRPDELVHLVLDSLARTRS